MVHADSNSGPSVREASTLTNKIRELGLDIFQNGGLVEYLKFGRKNRSVLA